MDEPAAERGIRVTQIDTEPVGPHPAARSEPGGPDHQRLVDHLDPWLVNLLTVLGLGLPVVAYFWYVGTYSVNVLTNDQWSDIPVIKHNWHHLDVSALWVPHNESRVFFPNIVVVLLAHTVHFNIRVEELLSAVMLTAALALLIWAHKRRSPSVPWLYYSPAVVLGFSFVQYGNALWGFQIAWYMLLLALAAVIALLDRLSLGWLTLAGAVAAAVVGSFSSVQGLLIWPIGLILMYHRRRRPWVAAVWIACAIATAFLYYHDFHNSAGGKDPDYSLRHPTAALKFFLFLVGDIVGLVRTSAHPGNTAVILFGLLVTVLAVIAILVYGIRRDPDDGSPVGVALICFGLGFAVLVTEGRDLSGTVGASASRYATFDLMILIGVYLTFLQRPLLGSSADPASHRRGFWSIARWINRIGFRWARWIAIGAIVIQVRYGIPNGIHQGRYRHTFQLHAALVLKNIDQYKNGEVAKYLDEFNKDSYIRELAKTAQRERLSVFGDLPPPKG